MSVVFVVRICFLFDAIIWQHDPGACQQAAILLVSHFLIWGLVVHYYYDTREEDEEEDDEKKLYGLDVPTWQRSRKNINRCALFAFLVPHYFCSFFL